MTGLEYATDTQATVVGKPEKAFFLEALRDLNCSPEEAVMIGDVSMNMHRTVIFESWVSLSRTRIILHSKKKKNIYIYIYCMKKTKCILGHLFIYFIIK